MYDQSMGKLSRDLIRQAMAQIGAKGGKRSLETMTAEERSARAKKASLAAVKKRAEKRLTADKEKKAPTSRKSR
jgi:hypothetical protein